ncbi:CD109 antigen [Conger conger]|uniref:CD109 antigen n=1 Tax=Conger conger TaxID=82655 RepID=UPI002A5AB3E6|nr:CD109 antigen [Conger conger]
MSPSASSDIKEPPRPSPSYLISSPQVLRPKINTSLSVTVLAQYPLRVTSEIVNGNTSVVSAQEGLFQGGKRVESRIPDSAIHYSSPYTLVVMGYVRERLVFTNSSVLRFSPKSYSTFIQTDKSTYKPGQAVKIRTVSIFPDGKPCKSKVDIVIKDPKRNTILQWMTLDSFLGVVSREFQLSDNPPLGEWAIEATVDGVLSEKTFTVDNYVLPKFDIQIQAPTAIYYTDDLTGTVRSHYTFGKPVKGLLTVTAQFQIYAKPMSANKTMEIDGSAHFIFNQNDLYEYSKHNERDEVIYLTASVTTFTGLTYNTTIEVNVIRNKYQLTFLESSSALRPSLNFSTYLKVRSYSKTLTAEILRENVTVTVTQLKSSPWSWRQDEWDSLWPQGRNGSEFLQGLPGRGPLGEDDAQLMTMTFPVPADGVIPIQVLVSDYVATVIIKATLGDSKATLQMYSSYSSPTSSYIQISRDHSPIQVGVPLHLVVQSNFPLREFHYLLVCRGQVVAAGKGSHSFTLTPDESWAPHASVIVYTVLANGEVVNDMMVIPVAQVLRNNVSLSWSQASVKPGEEVTLGVSVMEPKSLVGILVVDKAAKLLKQDNDITLEAVLEELTEYDTDKKVSSPWREIMRSDPYSIFEACNLMVLTDATLSKVKAQEHVPMFPGEGIQELFQAEEVVASEPRVRKLFPETWLWLDANMSDSTTASFSVTVPDSITSWIATGFVMSENRGLGLVSLPQKLTVFKNFFLALKLPRLIVRGESIVLEAIVFNYLPHELEVMVIVAESEAFDFDNVPDHDLSMASTQTVYVGSQDSATALFPLRPKMLGEIPISVKAISAVSSDAIIKNILIKPEGIERTFSKSIFLELDSAEHRLMRVINFTFPPDVVQGSQRAEVAAVGDILGPSITGLESLIQMPYGCGEQNMINFAPNVYVLQYLVKAGQVTEKIRSKSISFMTQGYQRELSYQRIDGSFSAFGNSDASGSTWLSAFVLRCFLQARPYIYVDPGVLSRTAAWLVKQQRPDGAFLEPGRVIHTELQGGLDGPVALTAYVLHALLEDPAYMIEYDKTLTQALAFLERKLESGISSNYSLCLVAYALSLANHSSANKALMELFDRAAIQDNVMSWSSSGLLKTRRPRSSDIEMAAYVLLSVFKLGMLDKGFPLLKWLIVQRNHLGGFGSTQDTIIALQALSWYAGLGSSSAIDLSIKVVHKPSLMEARFHIDSTNYLLRQSQEIDAERDINIEVFAEGRGFALLQLNVFYNLESGGLAWRRRDTEEEDAFYLTVEVTDGSLDHLTIHVCTRLLESEGINQTGMAIMEVGLLSGFVLDQNGVETSYVIKKVDEDQERVHIYLDSVTLMPLCVKIRLIRDFKVAKVEDAVVVVYDYYEPGRRAEQTYNFQALRNTSPCDFCGYDCHQCTGLTYASASPSLSHSAAWIPAALLLLFLA